VNLFAIEVYHVIFWLSHSEAQVIFNSEVWNKVLAALYCVNIDLLNHLLWFTFWDLLIQRLEVEGIRLEACLWLKMVDSLILVLALINFMAF